MMTVILALFSIFLLVICSILVHNIDSLKRKVKEHLATIAKQKTDLDNCMTVILEGKKPGCDLIGHDWGKIRFFYPKGTSVYPSPLYKESMYISPSTTEVGLVNYAGVRIIIDEEPGCHLYEVKVCRGCGASIPSTIGELSLLPLIADMSEEPRTNYLKKKARIKKA